MDPLSIVASIIAVVQMADRVISLCRFYLELSRDAPSDLRVIMIETSALRTILDNIEFLVSKGHAPANLHTLDGDGGPIEGCHKALDQLSGLFSSEYAHDSNRSKRRKVKATLATLAWPFKESTARKLLAEVVQHKTTLNLALTADISHDVKDIKAITSEIHATLTEFQRQAVYKWLDAIDPSSLHHRACDQYEPGTGDWVLRSDHWKAWISGQKRALWIHGIPGAGKTVLTSHLIESIKIHCNVDRASQRRTAYIYYYCYFGHNTDEALPFLKWTVRQLCRTADVVPAELYELYKRGEGLSLTDLLCVLHEIAETFESVYVVLDAIDESLPRVNLLKVLRDLITDPRFGKIRILATSREYLDIEESMEGISTPISMRNSLLDEDIRLFVQAQLNTHPKLRLWPTGVRDEALEALSTKAKGMFRWVVCQIDILQRLKPDRGTITKALESLPRTLDETYERIFLQIPDEARLFVHHALKWIHAHNKLYGNQISAPVLIQAVSRSTAEIDSSVHDYRHDEDRLREYCGCLISVTSQAHRWGGGVCVPTNVVSFAHYTVLEFLNSARIRIGPASWFAVDKELVKLEFAKMVLLEALNTKGNELWNPEEIDGNDTYNIYDALEEDFDLYSILSSILVVQHWGSKLFTDATLCKLTFALFDMTKPHFGDFRTATECIDIVTQMLSDHDCNCPEKFWKLRWTQPPGNTEVQTLLNIMLTEEMGNNELARKFIQSIHAGSWLQSSFALEIELGNLKDAAEESSWYKFEGTIVELSALLYTQLPGPLDLFFEVAVGSFDPSRVLLSFLGGHDHEAYNDCNECCFLQRLLQLGADPNGHGYRICPLQIATVTWDLEAVEVLLEAGADPNHNGDREGYVWDEGTVLALFNDVLDQSPLNIAETMDCIFKDERADREAQLKIVALLHQHGALNFTGSEADCILLESSDSELSI